jgi:tRNA 2-selenouridine synthase
MLVKLLLSMFFLLQNFMGGLKPLFFIMDNLSLFVLIGKTGSGKTNILRNLETPYLQILDLESLAQNSGSVFGRHAHKKLALSQSEFCNRLLMQISLLKPDVPVITEWKGKKIGALKIPDFLYSRLIVAPKIVIERSESSRIEELKTAYRNLTIEDLYKSLFSLRTKFTEDTFQFALQALQKKNKTEFIRTMLEYYDSSPEYKINQNNIVINIGWGSQHVEEICKKIEVLIGNYNSRDNLNHN